METNGRERCSNEMMMMLFDSSMVDKNGGTKGRGNDMEWYHLLIWWAGTGVDVFHLCLRHVSDFRLYRDREGHVLHSRLTDVYSRAGRVHQGSILPSSLRRLQRTLQDPWWIMSRQVCITFTLIGTANRLKQQSNRSVGVARKIIRVGRGGTI